MMKAQAIFSETAHQKIRDKLAIDSIDLDLASVDLYSPKKDSQRPEYSMADVDENIKITDTYRVEQESNETSNYLPKNKRFLVGSRYVEVP